MLRGGADEGAAGSVAQNRKHEAMAQQPSGCACTALRTGLVTCHQVWPPCLGCLIALHRRTEGYSCAELVSLCSAALAAASKVGCGLCACCSATATVGHHGAGSCRVAA